MAILKYSEPFHLENYARVVIFELDLQRAFFHDISIFIRYSMIKGSFSFYSTYIRILSEPLNLVTMIGNYH